MVKTSSRGDNIQGTGRTEKQNKEV